MPTRFGRRKLAPADQRMLMALGHPVRAEALGILNVRVASPAEIARTLGLDVSNVAYHVRRLLEYECIELVETRASRGATEHFYRGVAHQYLDEGFWEKLSGSVRNAISLTALRVAFSAIRDAVTAGTFDRRTDRHLSVVTYDLDGKAWENLRPLPGDAGPHDGDRGGGGRATRRGQAARQMPARQPSCRSPSSRRRARRGPGRPPEPHFSSFERRRSLSTRPPVCSCGQ